MAQETPKPDRPVDARGLRCPLPLIRARKEITLTEPGQVLEVLASRFLLRRA